jgi:ABC-2 type transport system permease protein
MMVISFIIMPIFLMIMTGYVFPSEQTLKDVPLGVVKQDEGEIGRLLWDYLEQAKLDGNGQKPFLLRPVESVTEARELIQAQKLNGAIIIPPDFSARIEAGEQGVITLLTDRANPQISTLLAGALEQIMEEISSRLGAERIEELLPESAHPEALIKPVVIVPEEGGPGSTNYFQFMAPGVMAMVVIMAVIVGLATAIAREKESGTLDGLLVAPVSRLSIVLGKTLSQTVRGLLQGVVVLILAVLLFGVSVQGSIWLIVLLLLLAVFSFIGLGVLVSAIASQQETAIALMMTLYFPMLFLSGAFFPLQQMPPLMQNIARLLPLTYAVQALRKVIVLNAGFPAVMTEIIILASFGVVTLLIAIPAFNRVITR